MNVQVVNSAAAQWVTVADAARALSAGGDPIDASNVSRYLARFPDIPSKRDGKFRKVDLAALALHRRENVQVADRQTVRGVAAAPAPAPQRVAPSEPMAPPEEDLPANSPLQDINLQLKGLELRRRQREEDLADGAVIPAPEVLTLISSTMQAFIGALERKEVEFTQRFGRDIGAAFRKVRKEAQAEASRQLNDLARKSLSASVAAEAAAAVSHSAPDEPQT